MVDKKPYFSLLYLLEVECPPLLGSLEVTFQNLFSLPEVLWNHILTIMVHRILPREAAKKVLFLVARPLRGGGVDLSTKKKELFLKLEK